MELQLVVLGTCALVALQYLLFGVKQLRSPLRAVPGPFLARFGRGWYLVKVWQGFFPNANIELHLKHGMYPLLPGGFDLGKRPFSSLTRTRNTRQGRSLRARPVQYRRPGGRQGHLWTRAAVR